MITKIIESTAIVKEAIPPVSAIEFFRTGADDLVVKKVFTAEDKQMFINKITSDAVLCRALDSILYDIFNQ